MIFKRLIFLLFVVISVLLIILISIWINLKPETLTPWLEYQLNQRITKEYTAEIGLAKTRFNGLSLEQIVLYETPSRQTLLTIESINIRINPLYLLIFQEIDLSVICYEGSINGKLDIFPQKSVFLNIKNVQINRNTFIRKTNLILNNPLLNGTVNYQLSEKREGQITLAIRNIALSGKPDHTGLPFEFPDTEFEWMKGGISLNGETAEVQISTLGDLSANLDGNVALNWKALNRSRIDLALKGKLDPEYESGIGFFRDILVNYKDSAGQISIKISGNLNRPKIIRN